MSERVLVIGAHCDDESFGCLGTLLKHKEAGDEIYFLAFTTGRDTLAGYETAIRYFNGQGTYPIFKDQELDTYPIKELISHVERVIEWWKPSVVYTNFIGDLNRDHRLVSEATMVACRPYLPNAPKEVWMYSIKGTTEFGLRSFVATRIEQIDVNKKCELLDMWYPGERINGRENVSFNECFEEWPLSRSRHY